MTTPTPTRARRRLPPAFAAGAILTALIIGAALLAPVVAPYPPTAQNLAAGLQPPSLAHWFGTDQLGRDIFSRVLFAARTDLRIALVAAIAPFAAGTLVGLLAGYFGRNLRGLVGWATDRVTDTVIAFPFYVLVIAIVFAVGAGERGIILTFALVGWVGYARVLGAMTATLRDAEWVRAARGGGLSHSRVLLRHVLPNVLPQAVVLLTTEIVLIMVAIVTLGYLGLGIQPPTPDWGTMISDGQLFITTHWWLSAMPGLAVVVTGIAFSLLGDGAGDLLRIGRDPSPRGRAARRPGASSPAGAGSGGGETHRPPEADPWSVGLPTAGSAGRDAGRGAGRGAGRDGSSPAVPGAVRVRGLRVENREGSPLVGGAAATGLDLAIEPGDALGIVGESGSGKSLTLRAILGMMPAGTRVAGGSAEAGGRVGMVFQDPLTALDPLTRVGTQLREAVRAGGPGGAREARQGSLADRALELLGTVGLPDPQRIARSYPHQLSGGQRQRAVIAMALAGDPDVLLCDEPTTALDVTVQQQVLELLARLRRERGLTLVFVSHDLAVVAEMCERVVVMRGGCAVEAGETEAVVRDPREPYTRALLTALPELPPLAHPFAPPLAPAHAPGLAPAPAPAPVPAPAPAPADLTISAVSRGSEQQKLSTRRGGPTGGAPAPATSADPVTAPALELRDVSVSYGRDRAVGGASFVLGRGGALGVVGESGSGKTTLARAIVGQLPVSAGEVRLDGAPLPRRRGAALRRAVQLVPQDPYSSLNPRMTAGATLAELAGRDRVLELLDMVRLDAGFATSYPHELSGGQRQRVAIARALAVSPRVLVADEPTSALDVSVQAEIIELLQGLQRDLGLALVFVSHDLAVVHQLCDEVVVMRDGMIVEHGGADFFTHPRDPYSRRLLSAVPRL